MSAASAPVDVYDNRKDWLAARRSLIGASDSAALFGVGYANQSPLTLWRSKIYGEDDAVDSKRLRIGQLIEPALRSIFSEETGLPCESPGDMVIQRHREIDYLGATLDGWTVDPDVGQVPVELKNVDRFMRDDWEDGEAPLKYQIQVQHQMDVTGTPRAYLFGLIGGNEPIVRVIDRNDRFIAAMHERQAEFWRCVESQELPEMDGSAATAAALARLYPQDTGETVTLGSEYAELHEQLVKAKADEKDAQARRRAAENELKCAIGDATYGEIPGVGRYSWKSQTRKEHIVKESTFRVLRCKLA